MNFTEENTEKIKNPASLICYNKAALAPPDLKPFKNLV
jgi:hypothetical protein